MLDRTELLQWAEKFSYSSKVLAKREHGEQIYEWTSGKAAFTMEELLGDCLRLERPAWTRAARTWVGEVLAMLGWFKVDRGSEAAPRYVYVKRSAK